MKKTIHSILLAVCTLSLISLQQASAAHHEADLLKAKIGQFYMNLASGDFEAALDFVKSGSSGYMPYGLLGDIPNDEAKAAAVANMAEEREQGHIVRVMPKHISIQLLGDGHALATYYAEGSISSPDGEEEHVINRVSLIWAGEGNDWQIVHWHVSKLEREDEDDD